VRRCLQILACSLALATLGLLLTASALASGTGTSAGDQQYIDPLAATTTTSSQASTTPATTAPNSPAATTTTPPASASTTSDTAPSTTTSSSDAPKASGTLPFTGLDVEACLAIGLALLGGGLAVRRLVARA
jgi:hypothetical protein